MSITCPQCKSTDIHDGYPERIGYWVCVNCGHQWKQRYRPPNLTLADLVRAAHLAGAKVEIRLVPIKGKGKRGRKS